VTRRDVYDVLFRAERALREARLDKQADEFLERASNCSSYYDMVRVASEYVELFGATRPEHTDTSLPDNGHVPVFLLDPVSWKILDANQTAAERLGYSVEALTRMSVGDLAYPPMAPNGSCSAAGRNRNRAIRKELRDTGRVTFESTHRRSDGTRVPVDVTLSVTECRGRPAVLATTRDISQRKQMLADLDQALEQISLAAETVGAGVGMQDRKGVLRYVNGTAAEMLGYDVNELVGQPTAVILHSEDHQILKQQLTKRRYGILDPYEHRNVTKRGQTLHVTTAPVPLFDADGNYQGSIGTSVPVKEKSSLLRSTRTDAIEQLVEWETKLLMRLRPHD
jgi:PAS domain S-box-containing protein